MDEEGDSIKDEDMEGIEEKGKNKRKRTGMFGTKCTITTVLFYSAVFLLHVSVYCATQTND